MTVGFLDRSRTIAPDMLRRCRTPPAALSIHLSIGQAYAWSVFTPGLEKTLHLSGTQSALPFELAIVMLGLSAAFGGTLVERNGPRWAMFVSMVCFSTGFLVSALGAFTSQFWLIVLGYGFIGGIGLGIGYISPVSTLIKWFPDRPGLATGLAIMGFGGGALVASPLSRPLLALYDPASHPSVASSVASGRALVLLFVTLRMAYFVIMMFGVVNVRVPPPGWLPAGFDPAAAAA